jgi:general secretion pathway protein K
MNTRTISGKRRRGSALLTVLWFSAALGAIAFSLANTVRGETERTTTALEGARSYYLATGAVERALLYLQWGPSFRLPDGSFRYYTPGNPLLPLSFPSGEAVVEIMPESAKINVNAARPEELFRLLLYLGAEPERAREIALGIVDWRSPAPGPTAFDQYYLALAPSFRARHASFEEIEELLLIKGMTSELFHGTYEPDAEGRLAPRPGLKDCLTVYGAGGQFDVNTVEPAVLAAAGISPDVIAAIIQVRRVAPFRSGAQLAAFLQGAGPVLNRLRVGGNSIFTLRATARLRLPNGGLSDQRRSVAAVVKLNPEESNEPHHILRWYDNVWVR